ncbi:MAG TPA: DnaA regulatory inactivator Hda, partial [Candidatus Tenderia electrophaga]|nr:DnaA regulatory inactivator Hda [Candidatus Tenderia electrophaga]
MSATKTVKQLPLGMWLREGASFENFLASLLNQQLLASLKNPAEPFVFLWGTESAGKSHLLQAACHSLTAKGESSVYLPMSEAAQFAPEMLEGLEQISLVAIDDVDAIAGDRDWETALFNLYNRIRDTGAGRLLVAANKPLAEIGLLLPDLQSRL